jgi:putative endonuclease
VIGALKRKLREVASRGLPEHLRNAQRGEDLAYERLCAEGFRVVARNYRSRSGRGEIDLLGWDGEWLACVEVKTRKNDDFGRPEASVNRDKQRRLVAAAYDYTRRAGIDPDLVRFDIVSVLLGENPTVELYRAAYTARAAMERRGFG